MSSAMRVVVSGGSGKIGRFVVRELLDRGHQVVNIDRRAGDEPRARFVFADLRDRAMVQPVFEQADALCHLGEVPGQFAPMAAEEVYSHNLTVASTVLQTAADVKLKRVIYTSTCQVYGMWGSGVVKAPASLPMDENHPLRPPNIYALAKAAAEQYAALLAEKQGLSVAVFRLPWVLAEEMTERMHRLLEHADGPAEGMATYIHAGDVARAYALALENPRTGFQAYHLTAADVFSSVPIRQRLLNHHPDYPPLPEDWPAFKSPVLTTKAESHFGWRPEMNLREIARQKTAGPGV